MMNVVNTNYFMNFTVNNIIFHILSNKSSNIFINLHPSIMFRNLTEESRALTKELFEEHVTIS